ICRPVIKGGDERKDGRASVGSAVHVANVDFVQRRFTHAQDERTLLFEADVGGALDQVRGDAVGDAGQSAHAAGEHDHGVGGVRAAGHIGSDIGVRLFFDFGNSG